MNSMIQDVVSKENLKIIFHCKGDHVSLATIVKICKILQCDLVNVIALVADDKV